MKLIYSIILIGLIVHTGHAQKTDKITFDGVVETEEWSESQRFEIAL